MSGVVTTRGNYSLVFDDVACKLDHQTPYRVQLFWVDPPQTPPYAT